MKTSRNSDSAEQIMQQHSRETLLNVVPSAHTKIVANSYLRAQQLDWTWYETLIALNENATNSRRRARLMGLECALTLQDLAEIWIDQQGLCALTGQELACSSGTPDQKNPYRASIDRIDNTQGYTRNNIRLVCHWANNARSTYSDSLFYSMCGSAVAYNK